MPETREIILLLERSRAYGRGLIRGVVRYAATHDPWSFHMEPEFYRFCRRRPDEWIESLEADGVIAHVADDRVIESICNLGIPAIITSIKKPATGVHAIETDDQMIGQMAVEHFFSRGFHHFAYCGFREMHWSRCRGNAFCRKVTETGLELAVYEAPNGKSLETEEDEHPLLAEWLASLPKPTALLACNDDRSRQVLTACKMAGLQVPDDIAILGVDNDKFVCETIHPQLSSIHLNIESAGYRAAALLAQLMAGRRVSPTRERIVITPWCVVERQSTDIVATKDRELAGALRFIREHAREPIQIGDVAQATGLSRRTLQYRFSSTFGCSIRDQIKRTRVDQMARMLISTDLTMAEIARIFRCDDKNISRYFRQHTGLTPSQYRKKYGVP